MCSAIECGLAGVARRPHIVEIVISDDTWNSFQNLNGAKKGICRRKKTFLLAQHMLSITPFSPVPIVIDICRKYTSSERLNVNVHCAHALNRMEAEQIYLKHFRAAIPLPAATNRTNHHDTFTHFAVSHSIRKCGSDHVRDCHDSFLYLHINYSTCAISWRRECSQEHLSSIRRW